MHDPTTICHLSLLSRPVEKGFECLDSTSSILFLCFLLGETDKEIMILKNGLSYSVGNYA